MDKVFLLQTILCVFIKHTFDKKNKRTSGKVSLGAHKKREKKGELKGEVKKEVVEMEGWLSKNLWPFTEDKVRRSLKVRLELSMCHDLFY